MKRGYQKKLAEEVGVQPSMINKILKDKARPGWDTAKRLAEVTGSDPAVWMEGDLKMIGSILEEWSGNNAKN